MKFGKEKELEIFRMHKDLSSYQVGLKLGMDKVYKNRKGIIKATYNIYNKVKSDYGKYGLTLDEVTEVTLGVSTRSNITTNQRTELMVSERAKNDVKDLVLSVRNKAFSIMDYKLDRIMKSKKKMIETSFKDLGIIGGIAFDKGQILRGEATENIALKHSIIEKGMSVKELLETALKMREVSVGKNSKK